MVEIGYHASHEQLAPSALLECVRRAEAAGFTAAMCSDHFAPWSAQQGHSGYAWAWLGAALQATDLSFGIVTAPGQRYHPAITAQAIATLAEMHPHRFWAALGSGEAMNEHITGDPWPAKPIRDQRLRECAGVIRDLLAGEEVDHRGLVTVDRARLWTLPDEVPPLFAAAVSAATAESVGAWADGLITINQPLDTLAEVIAAFRRGGGAGKPVAVQVHISWDSDDDTALDIAYDQWRNNAVGAPLTWDLATVEQFDEAAADLRPADMHDCVVIGADLDMHVSRLQEIVALGVDRLYLHHVGQEQAQFIDVFGAQVIPTLQATVQAG